MWYLKKTRQTRKPTSAKWISWRVMGRIRNAKGFPNISSATVFCIIICLPPPHPPPPFKLLAKELIIFCQYNWLQKFMLYILNQFVKSIFVMEINLSWDLSFLPSRMDLLQSSKVKTRMVTHKYIFEIYSIVNPTTGNDFFIALAMVPSFFINCIHTRKNKLFWINRFLVSNAASVILGPKHCEFERFKIAWFLIFFI